MRSDALFQLGMDPVELDATQTEDHKNSCSGRISETVFRPYAAGAALAARNATPRPFVRLRGNSAKALTGPA